MLYYHIMTTMLLPRDPPFSPMENMNGCKIKGAERICSKNYITATVNSKLFRHLLVSTCVIYFYRLDYFLATYISALELTCLRLMKGLATHFQPNTIVSFLHLAALLFKVLFSHTCGASLSYHDYHVASWRPPFPPMENMTKQL